MIDSTESDRHIRVVCTVCGHRSAGFRGDFVVRGDMESVSDRLPATTIETCYQCTSDAGYPSPDVRRRHFVDLEVGGDS